MRIANADPPPPAQTDVAQGTIRRVLPSGCREVPTEALEEILRKYESGQMLKAWEAAKPFGSLLFWKGVPAKTLAGRLASNLGAPRLGEALHWLAWRKDRHNPELAAFRAYPFFARRGPLAVWEFCAACNADVASASPEALLHFYSVRAMAAAGLHDFLEAQSWLKLALALDSRNAWLATVEAHLCEHADRYEDALAAARRALEWRPWYRPGILAASHALRLLDREQEALALLTEAIRHSENGPIAFQLATLQIDLGLLEEAEATLAEVERLSPLMERRERNSLGARRVAVAGRRGDTATALA